MFLPPPPGSSLFSVSPFSPAPSSRPLTRSPTPPARSVVQPILVDANSLLLSSFPPLTSLFSLTCVPSPGRRDQKTGFDGMGCPAGSILQPTCTGRGEEAPFCSPGRRACTGLVKSTALGTGLVSTGSQALEPSVASAGWGRPGGRWLALSDLACLNTWSTRLEWAGSEPIQVLVSHAWSRRAGRHI